MKEAEFFNFLDYIYIALMFVSAIFGFARGFVKDFLSTCAWVFSGFISIFIAPYLVPTMNIYIKNSILARCAAIGISYLIILVVFLLAISLVSQKVKSTVLSGVDRAIGVLFGLFRGIGILVCICILMLIFEIPRDKYSMVKNSKLSVVLFTISQSFMPKITTLDIVKQIKGNAISVAKIEKAIIKPEIKKRRTVEQKSVFFRKIADLITKIFASQQQMEVNNYTSETKHKFVTNKPESMSLLEERMKRRAQRKVEKLKKEVRRRIDREDI